MRITNSSMLTSVPASSKLSNPLLVCFKCLCHAAVLLLLVPFCLGQEGATNFQRIQALRTLLFSQNPSEIKRHLMPLALEKVGDRGTSDFFSLIAGQLKRSEVSIPQDPGSKVLFSFARIHHEQPDRAFQCLITREDALGLFASIELEIRSGDLIFSRDIVFLKLDGNQWKLQGILKISKMIYGSDETGRMWTDDPARAKPKPPEDWEVEDVRLQDAFWWQIQEYTGRKSNEIAAQSLVRTLVLAALTYAEQYPHEGYPKHISDLLEPAAGGQTSPQRAGFLDANSFDCSRASCEAAGYRFAYTPKVKDGKVIDFQISAAPIESTVSGGKTFSATSGGNVTEKGGGPSGSATTPSPAALASEMYGEPTNTSQEPTELEALRLAESAHSEMSTKFMQHFYAGQLRQALQDAQDFLGRELDVYGLDHPQLVGTYLSLAKAYAMTGDTATANEQVEHALKIADRFAFYPNTHLSAYTSAGEFLAQNGQYSRAEAVLNQAIDLAERRWQSQNRMEQKYLPPTRPYSVLADVYRSEHRFTEAEQILQNLVDRLGNSTPLVHLVSLQLAGVLVEDEKVDEAASMLQGARAALASLEITGDDPAVLLVSARIASKRRDFTAAEADYQRAYDATARRLGSRSPALLDILLASAEMYYESGRVREAQLVFDRGFTLIDRLLGVNFSFMIERERLSFVEKLSQFYDLYFSLTERYSATHPELVGQAYDLTLRRKDLVGNSIATLRMRIEEKGSDAAKETFLQLSNVRGRLAALINQPEKSKAEPSWLQEVKVLHEQAEGLEKNLIKQSGDALDRERLASWQDVQRSLKPRQAATEFLRFQWHDDAHFTGTYKYAALVLTSTSSKSPAYVSLGSASDIEKLPMTDFDTFSRSRGMTSHAATPDSHELSSLLWWPLETTLTDANEIFLAGDGILNRLNPNLLQDSKGDLLLQSKHLRVVVSTRALLKPYSHNGSQNAVLVGDPDFRLETRNSSLQATSSITPLGVPAARAGQFRGDSDALTPLPKTRDEVLAISSLLRTKDFQVATFLDDGATKANVESVRSPRILHIATHGFFHSLRDTNQEYQEEPLLRSGLYFAGAARPQWGAAGDNGVLTAYEASQLNLRGTELVVLSACETGLGEIQNGEGVFGLERSLQIAGADAVLISMWSVPDEETSQLMQLFYSKWIQGEAKVDALRSAQLEMRRIVQEKYGKDLPYYWGAFVLVE